MSGGQDGGVETEMSAEERALRVYEEVKAQAWKVYKAAVAQARKEEAEG